MLRKTDSRTTTWRARGYLERRKATNCIQRTGTERRSGTGPPADDCVWAMIEGQWATTQVSVQEGGQNNMDDAGQTWVRRAAAQEKRNRLSEALKGWWKLARPFKAWGLYRKLRATNETKRRVANERLLRKRLTDPALANLNEDQRRAVIVQEDRTLIVAGAGNRQDAHDGRKGPRHGANRDCPAR